MSTQIPLTELKARLTASTYDALEMMAVEDCVTPMMLAACVRLESASFELVASHVTQAGFPHFAHALASSASETSREIALAKDRAGGGE